MAEQHLQQRLHGQMVFLASAAHGLEELLGRGAGSITYRAGRNAGRKVQVQKTETGDLLKALALVQEEMARIGMRWSFEPYKKASESAFITQADGKQQVKLVFRNCMVRSSLFRYGHEQKQSLCMMNHGLFCGLLQTIYGAKTDLEILHAGENACIKLLTAEK